MKFPIRPTTALLLALATMSASLPAADASATTAAQFRAYFGTGRGGANTGFSIADFNAGTGKLSLPTVTPTTAAPSIFIFSADGRRLYTCFPGRTFQGEAGGGIGAFAVDPTTGGLTALNTALSGGADPGFLSLDRTGRFLFVANYNGGNIAVFALQPDGRLGARTAFEQHTGKSVHPTRQTRAYAEVIFTDAANRFVICTDLGLDKIFIYRFDDKTGALTPGETPFVTLAPGSGPRHAAFGAGEKFLYVIGEMTNTITALAWDAAKGALTEVHTVSTLPDDFKGTSSAAEILVHPNGKFLYASNRGHDSLAVFALDEKNGRVSPVQHISTGGKTPRCFSFDPTGRWIIVSNQASDNAVVFSVNATSGKLAQHGEPVALANPLQAQFLARAATTTQGSK